MPRFFAWVRGLNGLTPQIVDLDAWKPMAGYVSVKKVEIDDAHDKLTLTELARIYPAPAFDPFGEE